jgi:phosphate transport system protein
MTNLSRMAEVTASMVTQSIDAYVKKDLTLAHQVISRDDEVDALYTDVKKKLIALVRDDAERGEMAFDFMQVAKYYERIGDHAVNIAEWVVFSITGVYKDTQIL